MRGAAIVPISLYPAYDLASSCGLSGAAARIAPLTHLHRLCGFDKNTRTYATCMRPAGPGTLACGDGPRRPLRGAAPGGGEVRLREALVVDGAAGGWIRRGGRASVLADPVAAALAAGRFQTPQAGRRLTADAGAPA